MIIYWSALQALEKTWIVDRMEEFETLLRGNVDCQVRCAKEILVVHESQTTWSFGYGGCPADINRMSGMVSGTTDTETHGVAMLFLVWVNNIKKIFAFADAFGINIHDDDVLNAILEKPEQLAIAKQIGLVLPEVHEFAQEDDFNLVL